MKKYLHTLRTHAVRHKIIASIIVVALIVIGIYAYRSMTSTSTETLYSIAKAQLGTIRETVTGTGQVSSLYQLDITSKASGMITSIPVNVGDTVNKGDLLVTIDSTDALRSLQSAQISMKKLVKVPTANELAEASSTVTKAYDGGYTSVANLFTELPTIMSGMKDLLYSQTGFLSDQNSTYLSSTARAYRDATGAKFDHAQNTYDSALANFRNITRNSSAQDIDALVASTYTMSKTIAEAVASARATITFITTSQSDYQSSTASTAAASVNTWSSTINSAVNTLASAQNTIQTSVNSYSDLTDGADSLDIASQQISLAQAQDTYGNYFVRAPFDGVVGKISASLYGQAGSSALLTLIGTEKVSTISLNEIDASKVARGQAVRISFDAIDGLVATGTVSSVDLVGTVSSGVVTYNVKIAINTQDARIKPGMSLNATITTNEKNDVLVIPTSAIKTRSKTSYVQTVKVASSTRLIKTIKATSAGAITEKIVTLGSADDTNTEILSGLSEGDVVITKTATAASTATTASNTGLLGNLFGGQRQNTTRTSTIGTTNRTTTSGVTQPPPSF